MKTDIVYYKDASDMSEVDDNSIQLIITSPPYWNVKDYSMDGYQKNNNSGKIEGQIGDINDYEEYLNAMTEVWNECERVLKPNGKLCINTPLMPVPKKQLITHYNRHIVNINSGIEYEILHKTKLFLYDLYIWNRTNPSKALMFGSYPYPGNFYAQNTIEFINIFVKDGYPELPTHDVKEESKLTQKEWVEFTQQVWNIPIPGRDDVAYGEHPAIMPEEIVYRLVKLFSYKGDIVLDPFLGSGTTAKVTAEMDRKYVGYEINASFKKTIDKKIGLIQKKLQSFCSEKYYEKRAAIAIK